MEPGGRLARRAGTVTDDTLQAIAVAESLVATRGFSGPDMTERFRTGFQAHPEYYGPTSSTVFSLIETGMPVQRAVRLAHEQCGGSRTNGPVMRGAPIGIVFAGRMVEEVSMAASKLTHHDPVAGASSGFVNRMVSELCRGRTRREALGAALAGCREPEVIRILGEWRAHPVSASLDALFLSHAAVSIAMTARSFREAVERAVNMEGDTDTLGAVVGALAGAEHGVQAIPADWIAPLEKKRRLFELAQALARMGRTIR
ncbi:ADP-ribosyl-[dinitrogen reductase] glycohydrolase [anaerobic digester metagenome]